MCIWHMLKCRMLENSGHGEKKYLGGDNRMCLNLEISLLYFFYILFQFRIAFL